MTNRHHAHIHKRPSPYKLAFEDIFLGIGSFQTWCMLGWQDIRLRYRRSSLGPFWITLSMAITIYSLGILYSHLWLITEPYYILYFASGFLAWHLMLTIVNESTGIFVEARTYLLQIKIPLSVFVMRLLLRNFIVFSHNFIALVPILIYYHHLITWNLLFLFPSIIIMFMTAFVYSMIFATIGLRFRDIVQLISNLMNLMFFLTPVMWVTEALPPRFRFLAEYNPFAQYINLFRAPLMGHAPSLHSVISVLIFLLVGFGLMLWCMSKYRHRVAFWL